MNFSFIYNKGLKISIKWKLTFIITALMIGLLCLLTWTHISAQKKIMHRTLEKHINLMRDNLISTGKILIKNLIINVEKDMAVLNFSSAIESVNNVVDNNDAVKASILMDKNRTAIINSSNPQLVNCVLEDDISKKVAKLNGIHVFNYQKHYIEILSHVQFSTKPWGHLRLILNIEPLISEIKESEKQIQNEIYSIIKRSLINALIFMSISFMLIYYICRRITKKLINLTHSAELLSKGNFSVQIQKSSGNDEIAILQRSFAIMASNLKSLIKRLNNYNKKLESTVEERTMELKISEEKYKGLYNSSKDGIFYIDLENTFQNANYAFSILTGYSSTQLKKMKLENLIEDKYTTEIEQIINEIKQKGFSREIELNICHKSGKLMPVAIHAWLLKDNTGNPDGIWGFGRDISERKLAEKIRDDVDRIIRHDIKSPLSGIIGLSDLIMDINEIDPTSIQYIENIKELALNTTQLIDNSLKMHKMELGNYQIEAIDCDLISMLLSFKIEYLTLMKVKKLKIDYLYENNTFHENLKIKCIVKGEKLLLKNLFGNLIKNAIEASPRNETITINIFNKGKDIEIRINNQGVIPESIRTNFFDKYISSGKTNGTGLGTYSCKLIAKIHNGDITFETSPTNGTTLIVSLPASDTFENIDHKIIKKNIPKKKNGTFDIYNKKLNVLIADDSANNQLLIRHAIESMTNWKLFFANNGQESIEIFRKQPLDLILMDMYMPDFNGDVAIKRIREIEKMNNNSKKVYIIVISAEKTKKIEGADGYILKSFSEIEHVIEAIVKLIN